VRDPPHRSRGPTGALATIVVVAAIALLIRAGGRAKNHAAQEVVTSATAPQETESSAPKSDSRKAASPPATSADEAPKPRGNGPFTVDVGGPYDYSIALDQRDRLQALTGIEGYVIPSANGEAYRVVLGAYRSYERASSAANMLVRSRTLRYANVVTLPAKEARR
jgi:cell division protein FtsN